MLSREDLVVYFDTQHDEGNLGCTQLGTAINIWKRCRSSLSIKFRPTYGWHSFIPHIESIVVSWRVFQYGTYYRRCLFTSRWYALRLGQCSMYCEAQSSSRFSACSETICNHWYLNIYLAWQSNTNNYTVQHQMYIEVQGLHTIQYFTIWQTYCTLWNLPNGLTRLYVRSG